MSDDDATRDARGEAAATPIAPPPRLSRRAALAAFSTLAVGAAASALPARGEPAADSTVPACRDPHLVPNVVVFTHEGRRVWFLDDLLAKRAALVHFTSAEAERAYPVLERLARVRAILDQRLGARLGDDVLLVSIATDVGSSPHALAQLAARYGAGRGWLFVSAEPADVETLRSRFFAHAHDGGNVHEAGGAAAPDCSRGLFRYGNATLGLWGSVAAKAEPQAIAARLEWVLPHATAASAANATGAPKSRRRGPLPLVALLLAMAASAMRAAAPAPPCPTPGSPCPLATPAPPAAVAPATVPTCPTATPPDLKCPQPEPACPKPSPGPCAGKGHPYPQPQLQGSCQTTVGDTTTVVTGSSLFAPSDPFVDPPGTNLLPNVYTNAFDSNCVEMPNTLPSTPTVFYNLHDGEPLVSAVDRTSPTTDLERILDGADAVAAARAGGGAVDPDAARAAVAGLAMAIDILEGNDVPNRAYSGFPLLHYTGPLKYKQVVPTYDAQGRVTGGNVDVHQIWYDNHIEADTSLLDPTLVAEVPWTITYTLDVLDRGKDDFSPFVMYFDAPPQGPFVPGCFGPLNVGMDQTFFPIEEGTRTVLKIKMAPAKYFSLSYTWGWRWHPPRIQVIENATKKVGTDTACPRTTLDWEQSVFGDDPRRDEAAKLAAIAKIGDLAPSKVMWTSFHHALAAAKDGNWNGALPFLAAARQAFEDWQDRTRLPHGVPLDKSADLTVFYADNTLYAQFTDGGSINFPRFQTRGTQLKVALLNGDYFDHAYENVDFGGGRGWENQFKSSVKVGGSGCWFTFGRDYVSVNVLPLTVPAATQAPRRADVLGRHRVEMTFEFDPSRRLRFYQFDPTHHDVAIMSIH